MLDDDAGSALVFADAFQSRIGIGDVVVRQFLALERAGRRDTRLRGCRVAVEGSLLVWVFAIA